MIQSGETQSPCVKDCPGRNPRCHAECEKYQEWSASRREMLDRSKAYGELNAGLRESFTKRVQEQIKRKNKRWIY